MKFKILCNEGDAQYDYDVLEMAEIKFEELLNDNLLPVVVEPEGNKKVLKKFNPDVDEIMWVPAIMGG